jgi:hypothetical protein
MSDGAQTFFEIANDSPYPIRLNGVLDAPASAPVDDMGRGLRLAPTQEDRGRSLVLDLVPYGVSAIRIRAPRAQFVSLTSYPSEAVLAGMRARFNELSIQLSRLNRGLADSGSAPANAGFEPDPGPDQPVPVRPVVQEAVATSESSAGPGSLVPGGWRVEGNQAGSTITILIDRENPHSGRGSLRLSALKPPASVVSKSFAPNAQSSLTIQSYFRASVPATKVRIWIEGQSGGDPYVRLSELKISTEWECRVVRASDIPAGGLDSARLRFELLTPGTLWIDDLEIPGEASTKSARLNAQHTILAALQAYREQRYSDFARLAGSHWILESTIAATARLARMTEAPNAGAAGATGTGASALPSERKLR